MTKNTIHSFDLTAVILSITWGTVVNTLSSHIETSELIGISCFIFLGYSNVLAYRRKLPMHDRLRDYYDDCYNDRPDRALYYYIAIIFLISGICIGFYRIYTNYDSNWYTFLLYSHQ